ncbi:hypothetical protein D1872_157170 [compost metagenome]
MAQYVVDFFPKELTETRYWSNLKDLPDSEKLYINVNRDEMSWDTAVRVTQQIK